ncbi:C2 domain containing protein [Reticulomyxa filosa]|uniref:C2 domain containing protein n=1 Tax=Reticulomyxa filosa TaxID=46433 RepID=X6MYW9_RETFI|nr:C2 domain containing protein [Reticulomyxa filosa]|eukprot:ETO19001.1 C2 domain containing protein [Reticulomyxa filosa]
MFAPRKDNNRNPATFRELDPLSAGSSPTALQAHMRDKIANVVNPFDYKSSEEDKIKKKKLLKANMEEKSQCLVEQVKAKQREYLEYRSELERQIEEKKRLEEQRKKLQMDEEMKEEQRIQKETNELHNKNEQEILREADQVYRPKRSHQNQKSTFPWTTPPPPEEDLQTQGNRNTKNATATVARETEFGASANFKLDTGSHSAKREQSQIVGPSHHLFVESPKAFLSAHKRPISRHSNNLKANKENSPAIQNVNASGRSDAYNFNEPSDKHHFRRGASQSSIEANSPAHNHDQSFVVVFFFFFAHTYTQLYTFFFFLKHIKQLRKTRKEICGVRNLNNKKMKSKGKKVSRKRGGGEGCVRYVRG